MCSDDLRASILAHAEQFAREQLAHDSSGHDWWHIERVRRLSQVIADEEDADRFVCELAALLHDVADYKVAGDDETGQRRVRAWLAAAGVMPDVLEHVMEIIDTMSFGGGNRPPMRTLEGCIVQDADRLDAIGAIGVARAFAFGGSRGRALHHPAEQPRTLTSQEQYRSGAGTTITHFHEKLLHLRDRMNTTYARRLADERHRFMLAFLEEFAAEWAGER